MFSSHSLEITSDQFAEVFERLDIHSEILHILVNSTLIMQKWKKKWKQLSFELVLTQFSSYHIELKTAPKRAESNISPRGQRACRK